MKEDKKKYVLEKQEPRIIVIENDNGTVGIKQEVYYKNTENGEIISGYIDFPHTSITIEELKNNFEYVEKLDGQFVFNVLLDLSLFNSITRSINEEKSIFTITIPDEE